MKNDLLHWLPWLLSAITITQMVLAGNLHRRAWALGLANQALWLGWIVGTASWGFLPMNVALWVVYGRNHLRWTGRSERWSWRGRCSWRRRR